MTVGKAPTASILKHPSGGPGEITWTDYEFTQGGSLATYKSAEKEYIKECLFSLVL